MACAVCYTAYAIGEANDYVRKAEELWTPKEVADYLKVTERTVYRWIGDGALPAFKIGRQWRIKDSDVKARFLPPGSEQ